jgi:hypothetical protein
MQIFTRSPFPPSSPDLPEEPIAGALAVLLVMLAIFGVCCVGYLFTRWEGWFL